MIEQINIALEQKRVRNFSAWIVKPASETNVRKRHIHQLKVMKNEHPVLPSEQDVCKFVITRGHCSNWLQFYHFPDSDRLRVGSVTD